MLYMAALRVSGRVRRLGTGLALLIPAKQARGAGLAPGDAVDAVIQRGAADPFGLLADLPYTPFDRRKDKLWRERI